MSFGDGNLHVQVAQLKTENARLKQQVDKLPGIVRCRDCKHYYEADNYHPQGNYTSHCCKYFDSYNDEVEPDGFCAWASKRKDDGE